MVESSSSVSRAAGAGKEKGSGLGNIVLSTLGGASALRALRLVALSLIRSVSCSTLEPRDVGVHSLIGLFS